MATAGGSLFQTRAATTGNARSPIVECCVLGATSAVVDADRSRRLDSRRSHAGARSRGTTERGRAGS